MTVKEKLLRLAQLSNKIEKIARNSQAKLSYELFTLPLPLGLWFVTFIHPLIGFWPMLTVSTFVLFTALCREFATFSENQRFAESS